MADIIQYFTDREIKFEPSSIYEDVIKAKDYVHGSGILHNTIIKQLPEYLNRYLNKRVFLLNFLQDNQYYVHFSQN